MTYIHLTTLLLLTFLLTLTHPTPTTPSLLIQPRTLYISRKTPLQPLRCVGYTVNSNYRRLQLLLNGNGIDYALVTDVALKQCAAQQFAGCPSGATFCLNARDLSGSWRFTVGKCLSRFYVYLYTVEFADGDLTARLNGESGCDDIAENDYTKCAGIPLERCGLETAKEADGCDTSCFRLECTYVDDFGKNQSALSACLPSYIPKERFNEVCLNENNFFNRQNRTPVAHYCGGRNSRRIPRSIEQVRSLSIWEVVFSLSVLALVVFGMSVLYYRYALARTGIPPFTPPSWIPALIYPRPAQSALIQGQQMAEYQRHN